jgi:hypothetical protein
VQSLVAAMIGPTPCDFCTTFPIQNQQAPLQGTVIPRVEASKALMSSSFTGHTLSTCLYWCLLRIIQWHGLVKAEALLRVPFTLQTGEIDELLGRVPHGWALVTVSKIDIHCQMVKSARSLHCAPCVFEECVCCTIVRRTRTVGALKGANVALLAALSLVNVHISVFRLTLAIWCLDRRMQFRHSGRLGSQPLDSGLYQRSRRSQGWP